jgi:hypothetical protein
MADDAEKTEEYIILNVNGTRPIYYASRYGTKEKFHKNFYLFF